MKDKQEIEIIQTRIAPSIKIMSVKSSTSKSKTRRYNWEIRVSQVDDLDGMVDYIEKINMELIKKFGDPAEHEDGY